MLVFYLTVLPLRPVLVSSPTPSETPCLGFLPSSLAQDITGSIITMAYLNNVVDSIPKSPKERAIICLLGFLLAYLVYWAVVILYRLTFHPLAKFPGPFLCRVSYFYQIYYEAILGGKMLERLPNLHGKYGNLRI